MLNGDRSIAFLFRASLVICVFLVFGMILNFVSLKKDKILEERNHQTSIRISLVRAEYERKIGDLRAKYHQICKETVQEAVERLKKSAKETLDKQRLELEKKYEGRLKNQSDEIDRIRSELKAFTNTSLGISKEDRAANITKLEKQISNLKSRITERSVNDAVNDNVAPSQLNSNQLDLLNDVKDEQFTELEKNVENR